MSTDLFCFMYFIFSFLLLRTLVLMTRYSMALHAVSLFVIRVLMSCFIGIYYRRFLGSLMMLAYARGLLVLLAYFVCLCAGQFVGINYFYLAVWVVLNRLYFFVSALPSRRHKVVGVISRHLILLRSGNKMLLISIGLILLLRIVCVIKTVCNSRGPMRTWSGVSC